MTSDNSYDDIFKQICQFKNDYYQEKNLNQYIEIKDDSKYFHVKVANKDVKLKKQQYIHRINQIDLLNSELSSIHIKISSLITIYLSSKSNQFSLELKKLFERKSKLQSDLDKLNASRSTYLNLSILNQDDDDDTQKNEEKKNEEKKNDEKKNEEKKNEDKKNEDKKNDDDKTTTKREKNIRKLLFKTYEECVASKTSKPYYMSKQQIMDHVKTNIPELIKKYPKLANMKKGDICKVIFSM